MVSIALQGVEKVLGLIGILPSRLWNDMVQNTFKEYIDVVSILADGFHIAPVISIFLAADPNPETVGINGHHPVPVEQIDFIFAFFAPEIFFELQDHRPLAKQPCQA